MRLYIRMVCVISKDASQKKDACDASLYSNGMRNHKKKDACDASLQ